MSLVRDVDISHSVMDCLYPRDPPQPVRKKKLLKSEFESGLSLLDSLKLSCLALVLPEAIVVSCDGDSFCLFGALGRRVIRQRYWCQLESASTGGLLDHKVGLYVIKLNFQSLSSCFADASFLV